MRDATTPATGTRAGAKVDYEVVIVGAGPSGSSTALYLAKQSRGLAGRTLIIDKAQHPRRKLCAGALVPDVDACLDEIGLRVDAVPTVRVPVVHALYEGRGVPVTLGEDYAFRVCHRTEFDAYLAESATRRGVQLLEDTKVTAVTPRPELGLVEIETSRGTIRARGVVAADGSKSVARRSLVTHGKNESIQVARAIEILAPENPVAPILGLSPDEAAIELRWVPEGILGYVWDFPCLRDSNRLRNRGVYDSRVHNVEARQPLPKALKAELDREGQGDLEYELEGAPIRWFSKDSPLAGPHLLLVGDAAGVDPTFGEGISIAIGYGKLAAAELVSAHESGNWQFAGYRARVHKSALGRALKRRVRAARLVYGVRSAGLQRFVWWHCAPLVRWVIREQIFNWTDAARQNLRRFPARPAPRSIPETAADSGAG